MLNGFQNFLRDLRSTPLSRRSSRLKGRDRRRGEYRSAIEALESRTLLTSALVEYLTTEHVDIDVQHSSSEWSLGLQASGESQAVQYANDEVVLYAGSPSVSQRPSSSEFDFVGVGSGESFYLLPQNHNPDALFVGFAGYGLNGTVDRYDASVESKGRITGSAAYAKVTLTDVRHTTPDGTPGDGEFSMWQTDTFGGSNVFLSSYDDGVANPNSNGLDTTDGISADDAVWVIAGGHAHYNFGFTQPGRYEVDVKLSAYFGDDGAANTATPNAEGYSESDDITIYFSVQSVGQLQLEQSSYAVDEEAGTASIDVVRTGGSDGQLSVDYSTSDGTADSEDYTSTDGTLVFLDGETRKTITVPILSDTEQEFDETFTIELSEPSPADIDAYLQQQENDANGLLGEVTSATVTIQDDDTTQPFAISGIAASYQPGDIMQARVSGVTLGEGQEIQWRIRPVGTDFTGSVLSRRVPETDTPEAQAGRLDLQLDASYNGYELVASVMQDDQAIATTNWFGPITVANAVEPLSLTYNGPTPFRIGDTATLVATGRELADGESLRIVLNPELDHANLWLQARGYHQLSERTFAFEPPSNNVYPLALQVIRDGLIVAQSEMPEVDVSRVEFFFEGLQPVYRAGQTFSASITVDPDLGDKVIYSWALYDDDQNPWKVAQGEEGRTFEMPLTADLDGERLFIQARVAYDSGNTALIGGAYPYLTVIDDASSQLFLFSALPDHFHQGATIELDLFADPELVEGDTISWEWRWPGMEWQMLPGAEGLNYQLTAEQALSGLEVRATLTFADSQFDPIIAGPVTIEIDDHGAAPLQQLTVAGELSVVAGETVTLTRELPANGATILTTHLWERKAAGESSFTPVAGETGSTLSFAATLADDGAEYRVSILKPDGSVAYGPSPAAVLNVAAESPSPNVVPFGLPDVIGTDLGYVFAPKVADIDGDGDTDILAASLLADKVVWFENLGDGTFGSERIVSDETFYTWEAHPIDLDGDGDQDVIVGGYLGDLVWHENLGDSFGPAQSIDSDVYGPFILGADLNGDGLTDVVVAPDGGADIFWYANEGDGVIGSRNVIATDLDTIAGFVVRDLNGDGHPEVITGELGADQIAFFVNGGDGTFGPKQMVASAEGTAVYAAEDLNADGIADLLVVGLNSLDVGFHAVQPDGSIGPMTLLPNVETPYAATSADFDQDGDQDVLIGSYGDPVVWLQNLGDGTFTEPLEITRELGQVNGIATADLDGDGDPDPVIAAFARGEVAVVQNRFDEFATTIRPPAARTYPAGQNLDVSVHFGFPVTVTGTPSISLQVGDQTVVATYRSGSGTTELLFRYTVVPTDTDDNGIELAANTVDLNDGSIVGPFGDPIDLTLPAVDFSDVLVNGSAPVVQAIERASMENPTAVGEVTFLVTFSEAVTGVDTDNFALTLDGVTGAIVTGVSGSGQEYLVTVSTGTGSGTIGLQVAQTATIEDAEGNPLLEDFVGGEVFSIQRQQVRQITNFYTEGHGDIRIDFEYGLWDLDINPDALNGPFEADEVLIVAGPDSQVTAPSDPAFAFLGVEAGADIYVLPQSSVPPTIPNLGLGSSGIATGTFASYTNDDPRVNATAPWIELQFVDMRGPANGQFSLYTSRVDEPTVWIATSDGVSDEDTFYLQAGSHDHLNWAFTQPGIYEIDVFASGFLDLNDNGTFDEGVDRYTESGIVTY
uniref:choice-of-anchor M domain-containing protein n=1 Tax=Thalassoroseus pseudoceratinae TaxID=2713176 RepID=UPI0014221EE2